MKVQNMSGLVVPLEEVSLQPAECAEVEETNTVRALIAAGTLAPAEEQSESAPTPKASQKEDKS